MLLGNFDEIGGRQVHQTDLKILQEELLKAIELQYVGQGAFILQGCAVTGLEGNYTIGNGLVFINGNVMEFNSTSGITSFPRYMIQAADIDQDSFPLELGGSAYKRTLIKAELVNAPVSGEFIIINSTGGRNYNDVLASQFVRLSGNQTVNGQKTFTSNVITNGVNVNTEFNNINTSLSNKANKTVTITGSGGLTGGGDLTSNRILSIADGNVTLAKLASEVANKLVPSGIISMWSGSLANIPTGWLLCDGTNGTPNLKGKFIVGYDAGDIDYNSVGKIGGAKTVTLSTAQIPAHSHKDRWLSSIGTGSAVGYNGYLGTLGNTQNSESVGSGQAHENRPPYYTLAYIMKQ